MPKIEGLDRQFQLLGHYFGTWATLVQGAINDHETQNFTDKYQAVRETLSDIQASFYLHTPQFMSSDEKEAFKSTKKAVDGFKASFVKLPTPVSQECLDIIKTLEEKLELLLSVFI